MHDDAQLAQAADVARQCIASTCEDGLDVAIEPGLLFPRDDAPAELQRAGPTLATGGTLGIEIAGDPDLLHLYYVRRNPDLVITRNGGPWLAVEIDGGWHDTPAGRKSDDRRASDYAAAGMPLAALRLSEFPPPKYDWAGALSALILLSMPPLPPSA